MIQILYHILRFAVNGTKIFYKYLKIYFQNIRKLLSVRFEPSLAQKLLTSHFPLDPCHEKVDDPPLSFGGDRGAARHLPPLGKAVAAAAGAGVLRLEHGMPAHRRLFPVV